MASAGAVTYQNYYGYAVPVRQAINDPSYGYQGVVAQPAGDTKADIQARLMKQYAEVFNPAGAIAPAGGPTAANAATPTPSPGVGKKNANLVALSKEDPAKETQFWTNYNKKSAADKKGLQTFADKYATMDAKQKTDVKNFFKFMSTATAQQKADWARFVKTSEANKPAAPAGATPGADGPSSIAPASADITKRTADTIAAASKELSPTDQQRLQNQQALNGSISEQIYAQPTFEL